MESSIKKVGGHYQVSLPWRSGQVVLPNNRSVALKRLNNLKKRLLEDSSFFEKYREKIESYLRSGYACRAVPETVSSKTWYLPHHAVLEKFRVMFDCGATLRVPP